MWGLFSKRPERCISKLKRPHQNLFVSSWSNETAHKVLSSSRVYLGTHSGEDIRAKTNTKFISKDFTLQLFLG